MGLCLSVSNQNSNNKKDEEHRIVKIEEVKIDKKQDDEDIIKQDEEIIKQDEEIVKQDEDIKQNEQEISNKFCVGAGCYWGIFIIIIITIISIITIITIITYHYLSLLSLL